ncbi:hypothetical protein DEO72_LG3g1707 [Vigna unguiculata]|uniref:Uncharacterized protein n=1 Tax=Vigna unguiculata TaxID=3917 RepID=A0A4D6LFC0_VIGUN|nr:hypothetical protein DEO72_LG3g1707 [Vigna unguiculata]
MPGDDAADYGFFVCCVQAKLLHLDQGMLCHERLGITCVGLRAGRSVEQDYEREGSHSRTTSGEVRRGRTTSYQVRVSIINLESKANYLCVMKAEKLWGSLFLFVIGDDRVIHYTGADDDTGDVVDAQTTE